MIEAIYKLLIAAAGVTALVSTRVHYARKPEGETLASIVLERVDDRQDATLDGAEADVQGAIRVNCFAPGYLDLDPIVKAVRAVLHGYRGTVSVGSPAANLSIGFLLAGDAQDIAIVNQEGKALPPFYGRFLDVEFFTN